MRLQAPNVAVPNFSAALSLANQGSNDLQRVLDGFVANGQRAAAQRRTTASNQALLKLGQVKDEAGLAALLTGVDPSQLTGEAAAALGRGQGTLLRNDQTRASIEASKAATASTTGQETRANSKFERQQKVNEFYAANADTIEQAEYLRSIGRGEEARNLISALDFSNAGFTRADLTSQREANDSIDNRRITRNNLVDQNVRSEESHNQTLASNRFDLQQRRDNADRAETSRIRGEDAFNLAVQASQDYATPEEAAQSLATNPSFSTETRQKALAALPGLFGSARPAGSNVLDPIDEAGFVNDLVRAEQIEAENASDPTIRFNQRAQQLNESGDITGNVVTALGENTKFSGLQSFLPGGSTGRVTKFEVNKRVNGVREKARSANLNLTDAEIGSALIEKNLNVNDAFEFLETVANGSNRSSGFERSILNANTVNNANSLRATFTQNQRLLANSNLSSRRRQEIQRQQEVIRARLNTNRN